MGTANRANREVVEVGPPRHLSFITDEDRSLVAEIQDLHLASYNAFLEAGKGWLVRSLQIGEMLFKVRKRFFVAHVEHLKKINEHCARKAAELEVKESLADGLVRGAKMPVISSWVTWLRESGLLDTISTDTLYDYMKIYRGRHLLKGIDSLTTLKAALAFLRAPKAEFPSLEASIEGEEQLPQNKDDEDDPSPLERALQAFWKLASEKTDWTEDDRKDFLYDLREREKFAKENGWLEAA